MVFRNILSKTFVTLAIVVSTAGFIALSAGIFVYTLVPAHSSNVNVEPLVCGGLGLMVVGTLLYGLSTKFS